MQTPNFPLSLVSPLTQFDGASTEGMPLGCVLVNIGYKFGLFSLEKGALVLPVEYAHPQLLKSGLFRISTLSGMNPQKAGIFSFERGEFELPMQEWRLEFSLDHAYVYATLERSHPRACGVFSLKECEWVLPIERGCVFGEPSGRHEKKEYNGEEFFVVHVTKQDSKLLGLFSPARGFVFEPEYEQMYVHVTSEMLCATAFKTRGKECFVVRGGDSWKTPLADDVQYVAPPLFVLKQHFGGFTLYDAERMMYHLCGCEKIVQFKNGFIGVWAQNSTTIYDVNAGCEIRHISDVKLCTPIDDDWWITFGAQGFGAYSLSAGAVIIPSVFEHLAHIDGDLFFARWQGKSLVIDLSKGELQLPLALGAPLKPPMPMDGWMEFKPGIFVDSSLITRYGIDDTPATLSP